MKNLTGGAEPAKQPAPAAPPSPKLVKVTPGTHKAHAVKRPSPKPGLTRQDLASIPLGTKRLEVLRRFGAPASKISMPEEAGLVEVYHYAIGPDETADIKLINGSVTAVPAALTAAGTN